MGNTIQEVYLENTLPGHFKQYTIWIENDGGKYKLWVSYGKIGANPQMQCKTPDGVSLGSASQAYSAKIAEQKAKGYVEKPKSKAGQTAMQAPKQISVEGFKAPSHVVKEYKPDPMHAMLPTAASMADAEKYLSDPDWGMQEKKNGRRLLTRVTGGEVYGFNRAGIQVPVIPAIAKCLSKVGVGEYDGELIGSVYFVFDMLSYPSGSMRSMQYDKRFNRLMASGYLGKSYGQEVQPVQLYREESDKRKIFEALQKGCKEGAIFRKLSGIYKAGKIPNLKDADLVKIKFYAEGSFQVEKWNGDKSSVALVAYAPDGFGNTKGVSVGSLTIPGKYRSQIEVGEVIRVRYLYATKEHQLYQACLDPDDDGCVQEKDKTGDDCQLSQLKYEGQDVVTPGKPYKRRLIL